MSTIESNEMTAFVRYRLEKAEEVYEAAKVLYAANQWNSAVNRLYYACFYAASAVLLYREIGAKSHAGVLSQFSEQVVRKGDVGIEVFRVYSKLLNWRTKGDYGDLFDFTREDVDTVLIPVRTFVDSAKKLIILPE